MGPNFIGDAQGCRRLLKQMQEDITKFISLGQVFHEAAVPASR